MAKAIGPVTRLLIVWSSKMASSGVSGGLTSAVARTIFTPSNLAEPSAGAASTANSVSAERALDRAARARRSGRPDH